MIQQRKKHENVIDLRADYAKNIMDLISNVDGQKILYIDEV